MAAANWKDSKEALVGTDSTSHTVTDQDSNCGSPVPETCDSTLKGFRHCLETLVHVQRSSAWKKEIDLNRGMESLSPLFQTVDETPQPIATKIVGDIPKWISGSLLRNGPGRFEFGNDKFNHWVDGMALMHRFQIQDGTVTYKSKFLESDSYLSNKAHNRIVVSEVGTFAMPDPCKSVFKRFMSRFESITSTDNATVNYVIYKGDYYVSTETNFMRRIDPQTLETLDKFYRIIPKKNPFRNSHSYITDTQSPITLRVDWSKFVAVNGATAHPHYDPDGTVYNMGNSYGKHGSSYNIIKVPPQKSDISESLDGAQVICSIPPEHKLKPSYYHSFGMSENYIVFIELPVRIDLMKILLAKLRGKEFFGAISWVPNTNTIFHVVNKHTGKVHPVKYYSKPFAAYHQINTFEDEGCIVIDLCCYDRGGAFDFYELQNVRKAGTELEETLKNSPMSYPRRFVLPLAVDSKTPIEKDLNTVPYTSATALKAADGKVWCTYESLHDDTLDKMGGLEFPHINYSGYNSKKYGVVYGCGFGHVVGNSLIKMDVRTKAMKVWKEEGCYPSEPVFLARPDSTEEDDGVILSAVVTPNENKNTFLLVLDAKTFEEIGKADVPVKMPYGFHGVFMSN